MPYAALLTTKKKRVDLGCNIHFIEQVSTGQVTHSPETQKVVKSGAHVVSNALYCYDVSKGLTTNSRHVMRYVGEPLC